MDMDMDMELESEPESDEASVTLSCTSEEASPSDEITGSDSSESHSEVDEWDMDNPPDQSFDSDEEMKSMSATVDPSLRSQTIKHALSR